MNRKNYFIQTRCKQVQKSLTKALAVSLLLVGSAESGAFAASGSWNDRPSWASEESSGSSIRKQPAYKAPRKDIAPFAPDTHNVALDVGQIFLMGDLGSKYTDSIGGRLHYTYGVSDVFAFDSSLGFSSHNTNHVIGSGGDYGMTNLLAGLRTNLTWYDKVIPHAVFGLGFYKQTYQLSEAYSISPVLFGIHMGPGVDLELTKNMFFGAELTFHDIFGEKKMTEIGPRDIGGSFMAFFIRAGMTF